MNAPHGYDSPLDFLATAPATYASNLDIITAARSDANVLFTGVAYRAEALARHIHGLSGWRHGPFFTVDCNLPDQDILPLMSRLLLIDRAIAPTDVARPRLSQNGTVLLRDVGRLPLGTQAQVAEWLGSLRQADYRSARRRVMASSPEPLLRRTLDGTFDDNLYYRLNVIHVVLPTE
jgi:DNA-binding NtrC family response regulator